MNENKKRAFTLIELLVVISIIAMLLAILMPALGSVKERAKRIVCGQQLKQMGIATVTYASDQGDNLPVPYFNGSINPWMAYMAYQINPNATEENNKITSGPYNLGYLFDTGIIEDAQVFYCPSAPKEMDIQGIYWQYKNYVGSLPWPFTNDPDYWHAHNVRISYSYFPQSSAREVLANGEFGFRKTEKMSRLNNRATLVTDVLSTLESLPHKGGLNKPAGVNALFGDSSVAFCNTPSAFEENLWGPSLDDTPNKNTVNFRTILSRLATHN